MADMAVPPTSSRAEADSARLSRSGQGTGTHWRHQVVAGEMGRGVWCPAAAPLPTFAFIAQDGSHHKLLSGTVFWGHPVYAG